MAFILGAVCDFHLNVVQGVHLDQKKFEKFCSGLNKGWIFKTMLYSIMKKDKYFNQIYIFEVIIYLYTTQ